MGLIKEFKEFTMKGNLIDMSIGIVIGAAFGSVTKTFIDGIFMPLIGLVFQVGDLSHYSIVIGTRDGKPNLIMIGSFIGAIINFVIIAFVMFMIIKGINRMKRKPEEADAPPAEQPAQEKLLTEIRDLLKK
jgi:large conductance mechanosensitive channel